MNLNYKAGIETGSKNGVGKRGRGKGQTMEDPLWKALGDRKDFSMNHKRDTDQFRQSEKKMINSIGHTELRATKQRVLPGY